MLKHIIPVIALTLITKMLPAQPINAEEIRKNAPLQVGITDSFPSSILRETRVLNISFPAGYNAADSTRYPVIYLLDGGMEEDFLHISGLVRYFTTPWIDRFPASIVVGIESIDRRKDFTFKTRDLEFVSKLGFDKKMFITSGGSGNFIDFLEKELMPHINVSHKTNGQATIIGESLAGLLAAEILIKKPSLFENYIIVSPSLWWDDGSLLKYKGGSRSNNVKRIYIGAANKKEDLGMYNVAQQLSTIIRQLYGSRARVIFDYLPAETHATIIHPAVYNAFRMLYPLNAGKLK